MSATTNWPDPERQGFPKNPNINGWHWPLSPDGDRAIFEWDADAEYWLVDIDDEGFPEDMAQSGYSYEGECITPYQLTKRLAEERERCAKVCDTLKSREQEVYGIGLSTTAAERTVRAYETAAYLIRKLGGAA